MSFEWADWKRKDALDAMIARGAAPAEVIDSYGAARTAALSQGQESEWLVLSGRLAEFLIRQGDHRFAVQVYGEMWTSAIAPAHYGLQYVKLLLHLSRGKKASEVLKEMQARMRKQRSSGSRQSKFDDLAVLLARGIFLLKGTRDQ